MSTEYINQSAQALHEQVKNNFEKTQKDWIRDDQEILRSGMQIIDTTIQKIIADKNQNYGKRALEPLTNLKMQLLKEHNDIANLTGWESWKLLTNNEKCLNDIAHRIDNAENATLKRLLLNNANRENKNAEQKSEQIHGKKLFTAENGSITFTAESNPIKIHDALKGLFNKNQNYKIDYAQCKNPKIKAKMEAFIGTGACYISFDNSTKTYLVRNSKGEVYPEQRGLIREGVKLIPEKTIQFQWYQAEERLNQQKQIITHKEMEELKNLIPKKLRDQIEAKGSEYIKNFIVKSETRLNQIIKDAKAHNYQLHAEPIVKTHVWTKGMMEVKLINQNTEKNIVFWENSSQIGETLYDIIDANESDYKTYLTQRIKEKRGHAEHLTKKEVILTQQVDTTKENSDLLSASEKTRILSGLSLLKQFIENHKETEWDSRFDNGDKYIAQMLERINNTEYTLKQWESFSKKEIQSNIIDTLFTAFHNYTHKVWFTKLKYKKSDFNKLFYGEHNEQITAIRNLSNDESNFLDKTESSFLQNSIIDNEEKSSDGKINQLKINNNNLDAKFQSIKTKLQLSSDDLEKRADWSRAKPEKIQLINQLYNAAEGKKWEWVIDFLITQELIPEHRKNNSDVKEKCTKLAESLINQKNMIERNFPETPATLAEKQNREKLQLMQKTNKTEEDMKRLQALEYLDSHPDEQKRLNEHTIQTMKEELKYGNISSMVRQSLAPVFVNKGDGAKGLNADIYNDVIGYGAFNLSDENAKIMGEILVEIAITVAVAVLTGGVWGVAMAALLRWAAAGARAARWASMAHRISKVARVYNLGAKGFKTANIAYKAGSSAVRAGGLLIEGTTFNAASKIIRNGIHGRAMLDDMNLNPLAKENLQTAAFLGALSIGKQIAGIPLKIGGKTKLGVKLSEGLSSLEKSHPTIANGLKQANNVGAELGAMLIAEQVMNLTFGHDVLDPVTWEITTERALRRPDNQEWATMIGMILAFQVIKPNLYERLTQRLNNWTLEIYRTTNPNNPRIKNTITGETIPLKEVPQKAESFLNEKKSEKTQKEQKADSNGGTQKERQQKTTETQASTEQLKQKQERMEQLLKEMQAEYNEITALESRINKLKSKNPQSDKLNRREQNLKARKENYNKKSAEYSKLKTEQNQYMKHNTQSSSVETWQNKSESPYFEGKRSKLGLTETQARQNSETMDILVSKIKAGERKVSDLQKMADQIKSQYQQTTGKQLNNFTVENLMQVIQAHTLPWEIGKLSHAELRHKYEALNRSIADPLVKRFLLEAGFCGQREIFKPTSPEKINELVSHFDKQIMSAEGIIHNGNVYRLQFESNISQNQARKWTRKLSINGETRMTVKSESWIIPQNSNGNRIRQEYYKLRNEYVDKHIEMNNSIKESKESNHWENLPIKAENNLPVKTWENLPIKAEKKLPVLREAVSKALVVINKQWGLPAVIEKQGGLPAVMEKNWLRGITPPYWLIPLLIIPGIHLGDGDPIAPTIDFKKTIKSAIEMIGKDPKKYGVELDTDITGPFDQRADRNLIQQSIDSAFSIMLTENKISEPLEDNAVILLRGVSSWSYAGNGDSKTYNERLSLKRAEEVKKYLMQKYPNLTEDNFILGSFYQAENIDQAQRFQGISMWVLNVQNYWGIGAIKNLYQAGQIATPSWKNGRVL